MTVLGKVQFGAVLIIQRVNENSAEQTTYSLCPFSSIFAMNVHLAMELARLDDRVRPH
jgi:hypothetical protein